MRLAFEAAGCKCVLSCDWDKHAQETYFSNFEDRPLSNVREIASAAVPEHDILIAGFPCQPFSISGVSKKNSLGRPHGFEDRTQGTLFFEVARILRDTRPSAFLLENVKNLLSHDKGRTIEVIYETLQEDLGYQVQPPLLLDARYCVPQHRERVFIVGFRDSIAFQKPTFHDRKPKMRDILDPNPPKKYTLTDHLWTYLKNYAKKHKAAGNGFGYGLTDLDGISRTLSARYYKDGSEILIPQPRKNPRRLTPRECARLMGFPESFKIVVSDTQAYRQFGNSVVVPVVTELARCIVRALKQSRSVEMRRGRTSQLALPMAD
jgi:DNA (cytosine-5)-methyltransferase 1